MFLVCYCICTPSHSQTILLREIFLCGTHLSFGFFGIGPVRFFCVRSCLFPLPLGVLERRRHLFFYLLPQMKQNTTVTSHVNAKVNWPYASATIFNTNKQEGFLWSRRTDQKLRKSVFNNNPIHICPSVQLQVAGQSVQKLLLYSAICHEQLPEALHLHNALATPSGGQI